MVQVFETKTTILPGHRIEVVAPGLPEGRLATVVVTVTDADMQASVFRPHPDFAAAEDHFHRDLTELCQTKFGRWVAYDRDGRIGEGEDELGLFRQCAERGLLPGQFLVARVEPDLPAADIDENWVPASGMPE